MNINIEPKKNKILAIILIAIPIVILSVPIIAYLVNRPQIVESTETADVIYDPVRDQTSIEINQSGEDQEEFFNAIDELETKYPGSAIDLTGAMTGKIDPDDGDIEFGFDTKTAAEYEAELEFDRQFFEGASTIGPGTDD